MLGLRGSSLIAAGMVIAGMVCPAGASIVNPSFETGDFAGWTVGPGCQVVAGGASHGDYYASEDAANGGSAEIKQTFIWPAGQPALSVDLAWLQVGGSYQFTATVERVGVPGSTIDIYSGQNTPLPGLWDRYLVPVPPSFDGQAVMVRFAVSAGASSTASQLVDNLKPAPEPCFGLAILLGAPVLIRRRLRAH